MVIFFFIFDPQGFFGPLWQNLTCYVHCGQPIPIARFGYAIINRRNQMTITTIEGISIPDTKLAHEVTELVRDTESPLLFNHSSRVYYFGALAGKRRGLKFDPELLYVGAMFHDMGLTRQHSSTNERRSRWR